jgi:predicted dehydrogenase
LFHVCEAAYGDRTPRAVDVRRGDQQDIEEFGKELALSSLEPFVLEMRHFVDCVENKRRPSIDGEEACKALAIILTAYDSARGR